MRKTVRGIVYHHDRRMHSTTMTIDLEDEPPYLERGRIVEVSWDVPDLPVPDHKCPVSDGNRWWILRTNGAYWMAMSLQPGTRRQWCITNRCPDCGQRLAEL